MEFGPTHIFTQIYAPGGKFPMRSCQPPKLHRKHPPTITAGHTRRDTFHIIPTKTVVSVCVCLAVSILSFLHFPVSGLGNGCGSCSWGQCRIKVGAIDAAALGHIQEIGPRPRTRKLFSVLPVNCLVGTILRKSLRLLPPDVIR